MLHGNSVTEMVYFLCCGKSVSYYNWLMETEHSSYFLRHTKHTNKVTCRGSITWWIIYIQTMILLAGLKGGCTFFAWLPLNQGDYEC